VAVSRKAADEARTLLAQGRTTEASGLLDSVVGADPHDLDARRLRAEIAIRDGRMRSAREDLEFLLRRAPDDVRVLQTLAGVCHATGDTAAALTHLARALDLAPQDPRLWHSLGLVCHGAGRYASALDAYGRALTIRPGFSPAAIGAAKVRQLLGELDTARGIFEQVLATAPDNLDALSGLVLQEELLGNVERANDLLESVNHAGQLPPELAIPWARLQRRAGRPGEAVDRLEALLPSIAEVQTRSHALFALGQALDDLGETERAFSAFSEANALKPRDFDPAGHRRRLRRISGAWTRQALKSVNGMGSDSEQPVFIVGMPRSGTSLLEQIISRHPEVHACGELRTIGSLAAELQDDGGVVMPQELTRPVLASVADRYLQQAAAGGVRRFTDKMPANFMHLGFIQALFPGARIIHCVRDPLDTGLSCYFQDFSALGLSWSCRLEDIADYYVSYRRLMDHWTATIDLPVLEVRYENVVTALEQQTRRLLEFLDLPWDPACLAFANSDRIVTTASHDQVSRELYSSAVGRHRAYRPYLGPLLGIASAADHGR